MKKLLTITFILFLFIRCNKDDDNPPTCTTTAANIAGTYKTVAATYKETSTDTDHDVYDLLLSDCDKDDLMNLKTDNTFEITEGAILCTPPKDATSGDWSLSGSTLYIDGEANTIKSFDCKKLVVLLSDFDTQGDQLTVTFQKQ